MTPARANTCPVCGSPLRFMKTNPLKRCDTCGYTEPYYPEYPIKVKTTILERLGVVTLVHDITTIRSGLTMLCPNLTGYGVNILAVLLAAEQPLTVYDIRHLVSIPRTKIYGTLRDLRNAGLVSEIVKDFNPEELPEIFEWWDESKQRTFIDTHTGSVKQFVARTPNIGLILKALTIRLQEIRNLQVVVESYKRFLTELVGDNTDDLGVE